MDSIAEIYRRINKAVEMLFDWLHSHPRYALLFALALFVLLLIGLLKGWKWACDWRFYGKLWLFDNCKPSTRRRVMIELTCIAIGACIVIFFTWK